MDKETYDKFIADLTRQKDILDGLTGEVFKMERRGPPIKYNLERALERTKAANLFDMSAHNPTIYVVERMDTQWELAEARPMLTVDGACDVAESLAYNEVYRVSEYVFSKVMITDLSGLTDSPKAKR